MGSHVPLFFASHFFVCYIQSENQNPNHIMINILIIVKKINLDQFAISNDFLGDHDLIIIYTVTKKCRWKRQKLNSSRVLWTSRVGNAFTRYNYFIHNEGADVISFECDPLIGNMIPNLNRYNIFLGNCLSKEMRMTLKIWKVQMKNK